MLNLEFTNQDAPLFEMHLTILILLDSILVFNGMYIDAHIGPSHSQIAPEAVEFVLQTKI